MLRDSDPFSIQNSGSNGGMELACPLPYFPNCEGLSPRSNGVVPVQWETVKKRILIVDDDPDLLATVKERLNVHDFICSTLSAPEKVLERAIKWRPDLILLDLGLPAISGFSILRELKYHPKLARIPVVIFSGNSDAEVVREGLELGATGYLNKTCGARELVTTISQYAFGAA